MSICVYVIGKCFVAIKRSIGNSHTYRIIDKSLWDFWPLQYSSWDGHAEGEHVNMLHICSRNLITGLTFAASPRVDISSTCKVGQKLGVSLPLLTCSPSAWPSRLLYHTGRKSRRDLRITLYILINLLKDKFKNFKSWYNDCSKWVAFFFFYTSYYFWWLIKLSGCKTRQGRVKKNL